MNKKYINSESKQYSLRKPIYKFIDSFQESIVSHITTLFCVVSIVLIISIDIFNINISEEKIFIFVLVLIICFIMLLLIFHIRRNLNKEMKNYDIAREKYERNIIELQKMMSRSDEQWKKSFHLVLSSQLKSNTDSNKNAIQQLTFLKSFGLSEEDYVLDNDVVFYLSSYSKDFETTYKICKDVCRQASYYLLRGDEIYTSGDIFSKIIRYIVKASLIIVNIDGKNPNVFYELGIAHTLGKNVILISRRKDDIPFDIRQNRIIFYNKEDDLYKSLYEAMKIYRENNSNNISPQKIELIDKRIDEYRKVLSSESENEEIITKLAECYKQKKHFEEALRCYYQLLTINSENVPALMSIGKIYMLEEEYPLAQQYYTKAQEIDPDNVQIQIEIWKLQQYTWNQAEDGSVSSDD